ncbi:MAG TPA: hypothetical protein VE291_10815 [Terracidiphilus sp.]|jgi:hypothetical protein|nr:hypothetical protein [Terracidiphilus sp.]
MTLQIELDPETEARLVAAAQQRGLAPERYASEFLRDFVPGAAVSFRRLSPGDIEALSERLSRGSENLPILPPEVNDRESYYEDR